MTWMNIACRPWVGVGAALAMSLLAAEARGDAIGPPTPIECVPGSFAHTNHCGTVCLPDRCESDADCDGGERCAARQLCTAEQGCGGWGTTLVLVFGECAAGCSGDAACEELTVCIPAPDAGRATDAGDPFDAGDPLDAGERLDGGGAEIVVYGCGCRAAGLADASAAFVTVLAIALVWLRRARAGRLGGSSRPGRISDRHDDTKRRRP